MWGVEPGQLDKFIADAKALGDVVQAAEENFVALEQRTHSYQVNFTNSLQTPAASAMAGILATARAVEYLYDITQAAGKTRLGLDNKRESDISVQSGVCKKEADVVEAAFCALLSACEKMRPEGQKVS